MAASKETPAADASQAPPQSHDQDINPWSVEGAQDAEGNVVAIDYDAIVE